MGGRHIDVHTLDIDPPSWIVWKRDVWPGRLAEPRFHCRKSRKRYNCFVPHYETEAWCMCLYKNLIQVSFHSHFLREKLST